MRKKPATLAEVYAEREWWSQRVDRARKRRDDAARTLEQSLRHTGVTVMVQQVADLLAPHFPDHKLDVLGPFGLSNETSIHARDESLHTARNTVGSLSFRPHDGRLRMVDRSRDSGRYPSGTMGAINGLNYAEVELPETIEELAALLRASIAE